MRYKNIIVFVMAILLIGNVFGVTYLFPNVTAKEVENTEAHIVVAADSTKTEMRSVKLKYTKLLEMVSEPAEAPVSDEPVSDVSMDDVEMLAIVIYQEAGGDAYCDDCRRRVADVVLNRVAHEEFPSTLYGVLTQPYQYGRLSWTGIVWPERAKYDCEAHAVERAYRIAREVLSGQHSELYGNGYIWQAEFIQGVDNIYCCGHYFGR